MNPGTPYRMPPKRAEDTLHSDTPLFIKYAIIALASCVLFFVGVVASLFIDKRREPPPSTFETRLKACQDSCGAKGVQFFADFADRLSSKPFRPSTECECCGDEPEDRK